MKSRNVLLALLLVITLVMDVWYATQGYILYAILQTVAFIIIAIFMKRKREPEEW